MIEHIVKPVVEQVRRPVPEPVSIATKGFTTPKRCVKTISVKSSLVSMIYLITLYC